jgi:integrase
MDRVLVFFPKVKKIIMPKITKRFVEGIIPDTEKTCVHWDSELKGFGVVVLPSGRRTYCVQYRNIQRTKKRFKIGIHGQITTEEARTLAKKYLGKITHGEDPAAIKKENRDLPTIKVLAQDYLERHALRKRPRSVKEDQKLFKQIIIPCLGNQQVKDVTRRDIEHIHLELQKTPYHANRVLALLSKMFSLAVIWGWRTDNPVKGMERYQEEKRDRWLDKEELNRFWETIERYPNHKAAFALKILLLTGARKSEVLQATWDQFDLQKGIWTKPSHLTKQKKREYLPLSKQALDVLQALKKLDNNDSPYLFTSQTTGQPIRDVRAFWSRVLKEANLKNVRIHDLRHTHASHLVSSGLSLSIVGKLLGHTQASTTHRYAHLADDPLRQAAELFSTKVKAVNTKKLAS